MNRRRPGVDLRSIIELHLIDCAPTGRSGHVKDHRGRLHVDANVGVPGGRDPFLKQYLNQESMFWMSSSSSG